MEQLTLPNGTTVETGMLTAEEKAAQDLMLRETRFRLEK